MTKVGVLVDTADYALPPQVEAHYQAMIAAGISSGTAAAIAGMPNIAQAVADALAPLTTVAALTAANVTASTHKNIVTGWYHATGFGASPSASGSANITAIQAAITAANAEYSSTGIPQTVWLAPGKYTVGIVNYLNDNGSQFGIQSLKLLDGVTFDGGGATIIVAANSYGPDSEFGVFRSRNSGLSNARIRNLTIDGNRANQTANTAASNIALIGRANIEISNVRSLNANGRGIIIRSYSSLTAMTHIRYLDCYVYNSVTEGFQCSWVDGLVMHNLTAEACGGNGFDIYGDNDTNGATPGTTGSNISVSQCYARGCAVGFFFETLTGFVATNCHAYSCAQVGFWANRWHAAPQGDMIGCRVEGTPVGFQVLGDTAGIMIHSSRVVGASVACIRLGQGGNVSKVDVRDCWLDGYNSTTALVAVGGAVASNIRVKGTRTGVAGSAYFFVNQATSFTDVAVESPAANA